MRFDEYRRYDGLGLAELVKRGEVSASELLEVALARMDQVNPSLNAVVTRFDAMARARASSHLDGPFAGVPFLIKDLKQDLAGVPASGGSRAMRAHLPNQHSEMTRRWLRAGVVPVGVSNTSEFGLKPQTESRHWGAVHNPWRRGLSAGGSSGGAAAAVAAGMVPLAGGNDLGGSIRQPAALCGLFGFKPGRGRNPWGSPQPEIFQGAAVQHVLTRSVRDSAAMLDATHGPMPGASFHLAAPECAYAQAVRREPGKLRVGFTIRSPLGLAVDDDCVMAVRQTARLLASLGHEVEEVSPQLAWRQLYDDIMTMMYTGAAAMTETVREATGCDDSAFEPDTRLMAAVGRLYSAVDVLHSQDRWHDHRHAWSTFAERHDVWLTPTVTRAELPLGSFRTPTWQSWMARACLGLGLGRAMLHSHSVQRNVNEVLNYVAFTTPVNVLGLPAMSLPLFRSAAGMPVGVQCVGGVGREGLLFSLAAQLEAAQPWFHKVPDCDQVA